MCRTLLRGTIGGLVGMWCTLPATAAAQQDAPAPPADPPAAAPPGASTTPPLAPPDPNPELAPTLPPDVPAAVAPPNEELSELRRQLADQQRALEEVQSRLDDAESQLANPEPNTDERLKIYGFADVGFQRAWMSKRSPLASYLAVNAGSFVIGNLNLYFDAQPVEKWRALLEVRFTNAPNGNVTSLGGLGGGFERQSTVQVDPHAAQLNGTMQGGYTVIERAHIDYAATQLLSVRAGNFFTPFGIWNVDHGTPTLIALTLPQMIVSKIFPSRQTGVMLFGSSFAGPWELGYMATLSNGRQELSNYDFDDDKAYGGRVFARNDGETRTQLGLSYYFGDAEDQELNVASIDPLEIVEETTVAYQEHVMGADVSVDLGPTRIRAEGLVRRLSYEQGKRPSASPLYADPGAQTPDEILSTAYLIVAHQLPWAGLEPYVFAEGLHGPLGVSDTASVLSAGLNVHFTEATQLKTQVSRALFWNTRSDSDSNGIASDPSLNNTTILVSRLVMAF